MKVFRLFSSKVDFGAKYVGKEEKQAMVNEVFTKVANKYDLMNDLMSFGIHRLWKDEFVSDMGNLYTNSPLSFVDLAGGTGDIAFRIYSKLKRDIPSYLNHDYQITIADINPEMLEVGKQRSSRFDYNFNWVEANAEDLPFEDNSFDFYTIAFGIRNVTDRLKAIKEARRVLKRGGRFMCLEFSKVTVPILDSFYEAFNRYYIPTLGSIVADKESYKYLVESIEKFPSQDEFAKLMNEAGLNFISHRDLTFGIVAIHSGIKL